MMPTYTATEPVGPTKKVLHGHISPDTAHMREISGANGRFLVRYWIEVCRDEGPNKGDERWVSQISTKVRQGFARKWRQSSCGIWAGMVLLYWDQLHAQVLSAMIGKVSWPEHFEIWRKDLAGQLSPSQQQKLDFFEACSRKHLPEEWLRHDLQLAALRENSDHPIFANADSFFPGKLRPSITSQKGSVENVQEVSGR